MDEMSHSASNESLQFLCDEMCNTVFSKKKAVVFLSELHSRFTEIVREKSDSEQCRITSWRLKEKLKQHFKDQIVFVPQSGKSDLVCSKDVTIGDALKKVNELHMRVSEQGEFEAFSVEEESDSQILHRAAGIIRKAIAGLSFQANEYAPSGEIEIRKCKEFVPGALLDFVGWCTSQHFFESALGCSGVGEESRDLLKMLAVCHNIIALSCSIATPMSFGLGVQMHHDFGSKKLLDILHSTGYSVSYDEVRRFLTSVAKDELSSSGVYIPRGVRSFDDSDLTTIVDSAIDNFDQNEDTLDGKCSTHSMAIVLYQRTAAPEDIKGIPRTSSKALDVSEYEEPSLKRYVKPHSRPEPRGLDSSSVLEVKKGDTYMRCVLTDLFWQLTRMVMGEACSVPAWSGFNSVLCETNLPVATIRYLPFIHAPPSEFSTIFTTLLKLVAIADRLRQSHILVTADLAIYSKAQQILWTKPDLLKGKVTMRLGGMHLAMAFIASIGKLYGDGGLQDILTSSGTYATASSIQMLQGKHYSRGVRALKLVNEAMMHLLLQSTERFAKERGLPWVDHETIVLINNLDAAFKNGDPHTMRTICSQLENAMTALSNTLITFREYGRKQSSTFSYWNSFLHACGILLRLLRADRQGDFLLHLDAVMEAVPFFHVAGKVNYARYSPVYVAEMKQLETAQPMMFEHMMRGGFVVRRSSETSFNSVPTDQALEQTINREAKSEGGIIGFTLRKGALLRWLLSRHISGEYAEAFKDLCLTKTKQQHEELGPSRKAKDLDDVHRIQDYISNHCQDPFNLDEIPGSLINIVSGQIASAAVEESLGSLPEKGTTALQNFIDQRLVGDERKSFWDPLPKPTAVTFASMKKHLTNDKDRTLILETEVLFRRLLGVSKNRNIDMKMVLTYELAAVPPSLFHDDGMMRKTNKADLAEKLESFCSEIFDLAQDTHAPTAYIIDGMAMLQALNADHFKTFNDLAEIILKRLIRILRSPTFQAEIVTMVFDRYDSKNSIKTDERQRRGSAIPQNMSTHHIIGSRTVPHYRQYLKVVSNKADLVLFVSNYILDKARNRLPEGTSIVMAGGFRDAETVIKVTAAGQERMEELFSTHEEADTRMVLHSVNMPSKFSRTIIRSDDTDVLVLLLHYVNQGQLSKEVFMHAGHSGKFTTRERFIPIHDIAAKLGSEICGSILATHALTGCDCTSSLFGIGKKAAYKALSKMVTNGNTIAGLRNINALESWMEAAKDLVLAMYGKRAKECKTLDELRYFLATTSDKPATQLPPTEDAFWQHALRAHLQTLIWTQSHIAKPNIPDPDGHGWFRDSTGLHQVLYTKESAPAEVRDITHLYCSDGNCSEGTKCVCVSAGLFCIDICKCVSCPNVPPDQEKM